MNRASLALARRTAIILAATAAAAYAQAPAPAPPPPLAGAQSADGATPSTSPPNPAADAAYQEARRLYDLREWDAAIAKFKEAYRLRPDAPSLFNIAQANRLKGDCAEALSFYKTYRRNFSGEKNIDKVDRFIGEMETCVQSHPQPATVEPGAGGAVTTRPPGTGVTTMPGGVTTQPPIVEPDDPGKTKRRVGLVLGGVGVASLAVSLVFELRARSAASDAEGGELGDEWDPSIESRGQAAARNGKIALVAGGALIATGTVLYILGMKQTDEAAQVVLVPHGDGASFVWGGRF